MVLFYYQLCPLHNQRFYNLLIFKRTDSISFVVFNEVIMAPTEPPKLIIKKSTILDNLIAQKFPIIKKITFYTFLLLL